MRIKKGWECPKCGKVYAPSVPECYACNALLTKWVGYRPLPYNPFWPIWWDGSYTITATNSTVSLSEKGE